jgi:hypothetical protein
MYAHPNESIIYFLFTARLLMRRRRALPCSESDLQSEQTDGLSAARSNLALSRWEKGGVDGR